ncbi:hypothetical protein QRO11_04535 [Paracidovorax citrulli]|uniref:Uncharacterized protein n=2 Tax=Paracidovorax citrulli TaxID=80869 RepID=A1TU54_PARC0|nr:hypothetical protein [Paracidovorax citrulli]ABM34492.1 hypothetical protein Aave_3949 [Paracidovorax citrulli AAC00-1]ATG96897.1 hypothetical protein CQB05_07850 [Paracidovorax citrulli]PVY63933.1 hypothetical protein C8E08_1238 [Paracidovorax citrulli]QCX09903.1 hypothetical protein APS58_0987 [Paracidovorax citrulli]REG67105.1 hypothetical protein C8E07_0155 [Paracidovorax citrulli]
MLKNSTSAPSASPRHLLTSPGKETQPASSQPASPIVRAGSRRLPEMELQRLARPDAQASTSAAASSTRPPRNDAPRAPVREMSLRYMADVEAQTDTPVPGRGARLLRQGRNLASRARNLAQSSMAQVRSGAATGAAYAGQAAMAVKDKAVQGYHYTAAKAQQGWEVTSQFTRQSAQDVVGDRLPSRAAVGAFAGHTVQQLLTCGIPTFSREYAMLQIYRGIVNSRFAQDNPFAIVGMQTAVSMAAVLAHTKLRHARMDRDPEAAVKGHFGLTDAQWDAMSPQDKARHKEIQRADSRRVTANQVIAETGNFVMGATAAAGGDPSVSARVLATQVRNIIYAAMRELMQASLKFVDTRGPGTSGVNNANMSSMAAVYTLMTMGASTASDAVVGAVLNARSVSLSGLQFQVADTNNPVNDPQLENAALVALVRGLFNTAVEAIDAGVGKHYETKQVGARQVWNSGSKLPMKDHDRILDHSVARFSWNQLAGMANLAVQQAARATGLDKAAPALTSFLGVGTTAAAFGLAYRNTNQTYQAHARVRSAVASAQAPAAPATAPAPDGSSQATASGTGHTTQARQRHAAAQEIEESTDDDASVPPHGAQARPTA